LVLDEVSDCGEVSLRDLGGLGKVGSEVGLEIGADMVKVWG